MSTLGPVGAWGVAFLVAAPIVVGVIAGIMVDAALSMWEMRRRGEHLQPAPDA